MYAWFSCRLRRGPNRGISPQSLGFFFLEIVIELSQQNHSKSDFFWGGGHENVPTTWKSLLFVSEFRKVEARISRDLKLEIPEKYELQSYVYSPALVFSPAHSLLHYDR